MNKLLCPISAEQVNKVIVRLTGFFVAVTAITYAVTMEPLLLGLLVVDFVIRGFNIFRFSPLSFLACMIAVGLKLKPTFIDKAPKLFAARVGLLFSSVALGLFFVSPVASIVVISILVVFALLESLFDFCMGCVVYTYIVLPIHNRQMKGV